MDAGPGEGYQTQHQWGKEQKKQIIVNDNLVAQLFSKVRGLNAKLNACKSSKISKALILVI